jgi:hypothetical protein
VMAEALRFSSSDQDFKGSNVETRYAYLLALNQIRNEVILSYLFHY